MATQLVQEEAAVTPKCQVDVCPLAGSTVGLNPPTEGPREAPAAVGQQRAGLGMKQPRNLHEGACMLGHAAAFEAAEVGRRTKKNREAVTKPESRHGGLLGIPQCSLICSCAVCERSSIKCQWCKMAPLL